MAKRCSKYLLTLFLFGVFVFIAPASASAAQCWVKMKTGCSHPRANSQYPGINRRVWVKDWYGTKRGRSACLRQRRAGFNRWCRRRDAQIHWGKKPENRQCWVKMKTGCSHPRANAQYPGINTRGWVVDTYGTPRGRANCLRRKNAFNGWCRRRDAQIHWGTKPAAAIQRKGKDYLIPVRFLGTCRATPAGRNRYRVRCGKGPRLLMAGSLSGKSYDLKSVGRISLTGTFKSLLKQMVLKTAPSKSAYMRYPLQGLSWLMRGIDVRRARIGLNDSYGFYINSQISLGRGFPGRNPVAKTFNGLSKGLRFMLGGGNRNLTMDIVGDISNGELVVKPIIQIAQRCTSRVTVIPKIGTAFQYKGLLLTLYFKRDMAGFDIEAELRGEMFARMTKARGDGWIKLEPIVSIDKSFQVRLGGRFYGVCNETSACRRQCNCSCNKSWHPFGIIPISAKGGRLTVVFDPKTQKPTAMDAAILDANLAGIKMTGAVNIDPTRYKMGIYLKRNKVPFYLPLLLLGKLKVLRRVIPRGLYIKDFEMKISPTGGNVGPVDYSEPGLRFTGKIDTLGFKGFIDAKAGIDLDGLLRGKLNSIANASFNGRLNITNFNRSVRSALGRIPPLRPVISTILKGFQFNHVSLAMALKANRVNAAAEISFRIFGKNVNPKVKLSIALNPKKLASYIAKYCEKYGVKLGKLILKGGKYVAKGAVTGAKYVAKGATIAAKGTVVAGKTVGRGVGTAAKTTARAGQAVGRQALSGAKVVGHGALATGKKIGGKIVSLGRSIAGLFKKSWKCGWLCHGYAFHPAHYLVLNPDVKRVYHSIKGAQKHWKKHGFWERRQASFWFDIKYYIKRYPDVARAYKSNIKKIYVHYIENGIKEGRQGSPTFDPKFYLQYHKDVARAYGATNYLGAILHWHTAGLREGRRTVPRAMGWIPGKYHNGSCIVPFAGKEYSFRKDLDLLTGRSARWVPATPRNLGQSAHSFGAFRVCRAFVKGHWHPGFLIHPKKWCHYSWGGREFVTANFQILRGRTSWSTYKGGRLNNVIIGGKGYGFAICRTHR